MKYSIKKLGNNYFIISNERVRVTDEVLIPNNRKGTVTEMFDTLVEVGVKGVGLILAPINKTHKIIADVTDLIEASLIPPYKVICWYDGENPHSHSLTKRDANWKPAEIELSSGGRLRVGDFLFNKIING